MSLRILDLIISNKTLQMIESFLYLDPMFKKRVTKIFFFSYVMKFYVASLFNDVCKKEISILQVAVHSRVCRQPK